MNSGSVIVKGEASANNRDILCITFSGHKLANKDGFFGNYN